MTRANAKRVETPKDVDSRKVRRSGPNKKGTKLMLPVPTSDVRDRVVLRTSSMNSSREIIKELGGMRRRTWLPWVCTKKSLLKGIGATSILSFNSDTYKAM